MGEWRGVEEEAVAWANTTGETLEAFARRCVAHGVLVALREVCVSPDEEAYAAFHALADAIERGEVEP